MEGLTSDIVADDFATFQQATPGAISAARALKEKEEKMRKRDEDMLRPKQLEAAAKLVEVTKDIDEKEAKASVLRKIHAYAKKFPDKLKGIALTPAKEAKATLEELERIQSDMEHELGKGASAKMLTQFHVFALQQLEGVSKIYNPLNLRLDNLGAVAQKNAEQTLEPLWEEFAIKHADWFSSSVETRLVIATAQMIAVCHSMNNQGAQEVLRKAATTPANADVLKKAAELRKK